MRVALVIAFQHLKWSSLMEKRSHTFLFVTELVTVSSAISSDAHAPPSHADIFDWFYYLV